MSGATPLEREMGPTDQGRQKVHQIGDEVVEDHEEVPGEAEVVHGALHGAQLEGVQEGEELPPDGAVVLEHQVSQLDDEQDGEGSHLNITRHIETEIT